MVLLGIKLQQVYNHSIMRSRLAHRSALALCIGAIVLAGSVHAPRVYAQSANAAQSTDAVSLPTKFDAASIKPSTDSEENKESNSFRWEGGRFTAANISVERLIDTAYGGLRPQQLEGLPTWAKSRGYTIETVMPSDMPRLTAEETRNVRVQMLQSLLADRFVLKMHKTIQQLPTYEIVIAKGGPKLTPHSANDQVRAGLTSTPKGFKFVGAPVQFLGAYLSMYVGRVVIDKTGLTGRYDFMLSGTALSPNPVPTNLGGESGDESIFDGMKDQLGVELKPAKGPITVFVVDHVEEPSPN